MFNPVRLIRKSFASRNAFESMQLAIFLAE